MNNQVWKTFAAQEVTHSVAHYLTTIRDLRHAKGYAMLSDVAKELSVTKGSASVQVRSLKEKGLVTEVDNRFLMLTEAGEAAAAEVEYNRQVLKRFLAGILSISQEQAEVDACKIEHLLSREARHQIFALVQLLQSDDPAAVKFLDRFRGFKVGCPSPENCGLCDDVCLVEKDPDLCPEACAVRREGTRARKR
jgi:Mn-dependent DtxR family transcriptional regulator